MLYTLALLKGPVNMVPPKLLPIKAVIAGVEKAISSFSVKAAQEVQQETENYSDTSGHPHIT
jgi:hypothetical protein